MSGFSAFVGIDWSGDRARVQKGLQIAIAEPGRAAPVLVTGPWSRSSALDWIRRETASRRILIGLDFAFQFPTVEAVPAGLSWAEIDAFCGEAPNLYGGAFFQSPDHVFRDHVFGRSWKGAAFDRRLMRRTEARAADTKGATPSTPFLAIGAAQVGPSSISGMRALHRLRSEGARVCIWPFEPDDGERSVLVEIFPRWFALSRGAKPAMKLHENLNAALAAYGSEPVPEPPRSEDEGDALLTAAALRNVAATTPLETVSDPVILREGWIYGVPLPAW